MVGEQPACQGEHAPRKCDTGADAAYVNAIRERVGLTFFRLDSETKWHGSGSGWFARFSQVHHRVVRSIGVFSVIIGVPVVEPFLPIHQVAKAIAPASF